jgi:CBS domain-containing protein
MTPAVAVIAVTPRQGAMEALALLAQHDLNKLPVVEHRALLGLVRREDILRWLSVHGEQPGR